jgi:alpha-galactosidase
MLSAPFAGPGHHADPDMLEIGNPGLTLEEARTQFSLWAMWSAPLLAGHDPREMTGDDVASTVLLNRDVIAVDQDPLGQMATLVSDDAGLQVWKKPLAGGAKAVLVVNASAHPRDASVTLGTHSSVHDLWTSQEHATQDEPFAVDAVPAHASVLLRVDGPQS